MAGGGRASQKQIMLAERRAVAIQLRKLGGSFRQIAEQMRGMTEQFGDDVALYTEAQAYRDVTHELNRIIKGSMENAEQVLQLNQERLTELIASHLPLAKKDLFTLDRVLRMMETQVKWGAGPLLNKSTTTLQNPDGTPIQAGTSVLLVLPDNGRGDTYKGTPTTDKPTDQPDFSEQ